MKKDFVILVDKNNKKIGVEEKIKTAKRFRKNPIKSYIKK